MIKQRCTRCYGKGVVWDDLGGPCGRNIPCKQCNETGHIYVKLEFAKEKLERMKSGLLLFLEEILELERDIQNVAND